MCLGWSLEAYLPSIINCGKSMPAMATANITTHAERRYHKDLQIISHLKVIKLVNTLRICIRIKKWILKFIKNILLHKWQRYNIISHENNKQNRHKHINRTNYKQTKTNSMRTKGLDKYAKSNHKYYVHNTQT